MKILKYKIWLLLIAGHFIFSLNLCAQNSKMSVGFEFKPIIPSGLFRTGPINGSVDTIDFTVSPKFGYVFGMIVDATVWKNVQVETGICFTQRNYSMDIKTGDFLGSSSFRIIGYEIPLSALISLPISDQLRINNSLGLVLDIFPSEVGTSGEYYTHTSVRIHELIPAFMANSGFKLDIKKFGALYLGASYHLPFSAIYHTFITYTPDPTHPTFETNLRGNYLTIDLKYFFIHHAPKT